MCVCVREYKKTDISYMTEIWNEVIEKGVAFPQRNFLTNEEAEIFFAQQSFNGGNRKHRLALSLTKAGACV